MGKRVIDLTAEELNKLAAEAWSAAAQEALAKGLSVTGSHGGRRYRYHPDGRIEDLGPVSSLADDGEASGNATAQDVPNARKSVA